MFDAYNYILFKYAKEEGRYEKNTLLVDSNCVKIYDTGLYLWLPTEYEIFGSEILGTKKYSSGEGSQMQYPLFANSGKHRILYINEQMGVNNPDDWPAGDPTSYWLGTAYSGNSTDALCITTEGELSYDNVSVQKTIPVCFRIGEESGLAPTKNN